MSVVVMASRFFGWKATSNKCCASLPLFFRVCVFFLLSLEKSRKNSLDIWFFQHQEWTYARLKLLAERNKLIEFCRPFLLCMRNACLCRGSVKDRRIVHHFGLDRYVGSVMTSSSFKGHFDI